MAFVFMYFVTEIYYLLTYLYPPTNKNNKIYISPLNHLVVLSIPPHHHLVLYIISIPPYHLFAYTIHTTKPPPCCTIYTTTPPLYILSISHHHFVDTIHTTTPPSHRYYQYLFSLFEPFPCQNKFVTIIAHNISIRYYLGTD